MPTNPYSKRTIGEPEKKEKQERPVIPIGPDPRERALRQAMMQRDFDRLSQARSPQQAIGYALPLYARTFRQYQDRQSAQEKQRALMDALSGAPDRSSMADALIQSGDPNYMQMGIKQKLAQTAPPATYGPHQGSRFTKTEDGTGWIDWKSGKIIKTDGTVADKEFGTSVHYYRDEKGNTVPYQVSKQGGRQDIDVPGEALPGTQFLDLGTRIVPADKRSGQPVGPAYEKDIAGEAEQKEVGKAKGEAKTRLPQLEQQATDMLGTIDSILQDPYLPEMTGFYSGRMMNLSTDAARVQSKLDQLQGQVFLEGYERLKGGGVITDFEGQKAEQAIARLNDPTMSDEDFKAALEDLRQVVLAGRQRARQQAGQPTADAPAQTAPQQNAPQANDPLGILD